MVTAAWETVSAIQDQVQNLRQTILLCERRIMELQSGMSVVAEVASLREPEAAAEPAPGLASAPAPAPAPAPAAESAAPVHYRRWRNRPTRMAQLISIIQGRMNGEPWTVDMFIGALRDESGGALPSSMQINLPARLSQLCREGFLRRIARGQYVRANLLQDEKHSALTNENERTTTTP
jgi:hypothetical protein